MAANDPGLRNQALNLALMYQRQVDAPSDRAITEDKVLEVGEKFYQFLVGKGKVSVEGPAYLNSFTVVFVTRQEAVNAIEALRALLAEKMLVTVADFKKIFESSSTDQDCFYGWKEIGDVEIIASGSAWRVVFPPPQKIVELEESKEYKTAREDLAKIVACETSGIIDSFPEQDDYDLSDAFIKVINSDVDRANVIRGHKRRVGK